MKISIIIPVLNEEKNITKILEYIEKNSSVNLIKEIVIVDGGSSDNTVNTSRKYPNVLVFHSKKGKAIQMNLGASKASGEIVYFLHQRYKFQNKSFFYIHVFNNFCCYFIKSQSDIIHWNINYTGNNNFIICLLKKK